MRSYVYDRCAKCGRYTQVFLPDRLCIACLHAEERRRKEEEKVLLRSGPRRKHPSALNGGSPQGRVVICRYCGKPVVSGNRRPRQFCSGRCRVAWWRMMRKAAQDGVMQDEAVQDETTQDGVMQDEEKRSGE